MVNDETDYPALEKIYKNNKIFIEGEHIISQATNAISKYVTLYPDDESGWEALKKIYDFHDGEYAMLTGIIGGFYKEHPKIFDNKAIKVKWVEQLVNNLNKNYDGKRYLYQLHNTTKNPKQIEP